MGESLIAKDMKDSDQPDLLRRTVESDLRDRYTIESVLGFGRAARVYRAREKATGRPAALKVVPLPQRRHFAAAELFHRFERDAARTAALRFSHLVPIRAYGSAATYLWYEMDYVEAPSLAQQLESAGILELDPCLAIIDQMASALDYMHRRGVTHGNLRPTHIFVDAERWARLSDFNISRALEDLLPPDSHHDPLRVLQYVAPEQFDTRLGSPSADQYALAVVAYECLTGEPPFQADSPIGLEQLHQIAAPRPLHEIRSEIPQHVDYAIRRALSKTPHTRFANVIDFASMLHGGSWGPQHAQLAAPADVPLHAPRVLMGDPSPQRLEKLNRALSALPALASQLTRMGREALRRAPAPQPIITRQPTIPAPTSSLRPRSIEEAPQPPTPKIEESGTAPPIQPTEAPPVIEVRDAPPVVEAAPAPPVIEARDEPPVVKAAPAPPVIDITEPAGEEIKSDEQIATGREAAAAQGFAPVLPDEESEEVEPTVAEPAVEAEETGVAAVASGDNAIRQPGSPASQRPVWPAFEPAESPVFQHAGAKRRQSPLQVAPATAVETERGKISVVPRWRASLGRMAASLRRSAAGVSEALARIEVAPILAALGAFWRSLIRLLLWIWRVLVRLAGFIAAEMGKLSATIAEASRRAWAAAKPVLKRATGATGRVLGHWSRIAGAALLRLSKAAARALGRGSRVAGAALLRLSKAAARALGRGSRVAGAALLRLSKAAARALGRGSRVAGAALL
ncbi:MAG: protein kinase, partial [Gemmatimonadota bacterium]